MFKIYLFWLLLLLAIWYIYIDWILTVNKLEAVAKINIYSSIVNTFTWRTSWTISWIKLKYALNDTNYLLDITWAYINTNITLNFSWNNLKIFFPIIILSTGQIENVYQSGDSIFDSLNISWRNWSYPQFISGWNDYIAVNENFKIFLNKFYIYCLLEKYQFRRYNKRNKSKNIKDETDTWKYLCKDDKSSDTCSCDTVENQIWEDFSPYQFICEEINGWTCDLNGCINFITWTIDLNWTNCKITNLTNSSDYYIIR